MYKVVGKLDLPSLFYCAFESQCGVTAADPI